MGPSRVATGPPRTGPRLDRPKPDREPSNTARPLILAAVARVAGRTTPTDTRAPGRPRSGALMRATPVCSGPAIIVPAVLGPVSPGLPGGLRPEDVLMAHMLAAGSWMTSPITLSVVTALGSILAAIAGVWVLLTAGPRYRLRYGPLTSKQLPDGSWLLGIHLSSRGRRDITRDAFDEGKPVELDTGVTIGDRVGVWSSEETTRTVPHRAEGTCLLVGPGLIGRRQDLRFTVRAAAKPPHGLTCRASLINVRIRRQFLTPQRRFPLVLVAVFLVSLAISTLAVVVAASAGVTISATASLVIYFSGLFLAMVWLLIRFRTPTTPADPAKGRAAASTTPTGTPAPGTRPSDAPALPRHRRRGRGRDPRQREPGPRLGAFRDQPPRCGESPPAHPWAVRCGATWRTPPRR